MSLILAPDHPLAREMMFRAEVERLMREAKMPTERDAIAALWQAQMRLKELGWRDWSHMPKDGTEVQLIEYCSTGIHRGFYDGAWPDGRVYLLDAGDMYGSRPILYKPFPPSAQGGAP